MGITPDMAGFAAAQQRLRAGFGEDVTFYGDAVLTYPVGTAVDDNGVAFDPTVTPTASARASGEVKCDVYFDSAKPQIPGDSEAGIFSDAKVMLILDIADEPIAASAATFDCRRDAFKIVGRQRDGIGGVQRILVYGRRQ